MQKVDIYQLKNENQQELVLTCKLIDGVVECEGNQKLAYHLQNEGIKDFSTEDLTIIFPKDGLKFLEQLKNNFRSAYLSATDILDS